MDHSRKGLGDQLSEKMTPDSQKSTTDKLSENVSGTVDKGMQKVQPGMFSSPSSLLRWPLSADHVVDSEKSTGQKLTDTGRSGADSAQKEGKSWTQAASDTGSNLAKSAQDTLSQAGKLVMPVQIASGH